MPSFKDLVRALRSRAFCPSTFCSAPCRSALLIVTLPYGMFGRPLRSYIRNLLIDLRRALRGNRNNEEVVIMRLRFASLLAGMGLALLAGTAAAQSYGGIAVSFGPPAPVYAPYAPAPQAGHAGSNYRQAPVYYESRTRHGFERYRQEREHHERQARRDHHR